MRIPASRDLYWKMAFPGCRPFITRCPYVISPTEGGSEKSSLSRWGLRRYSCPQTTRSFPTSKGIIQSVASHAPARCMVWPSACAWYMETKERTNDDACGVLLGHRDSGKMSRLLSLHLLCIRRVVANRSKAVIYGRDVRDTELVSKTFLSVTLVLSQEK